MYSVENNLSADEDAAVATGIPPSVTGAMRRHWPEYLMEGALLGLFMISACVFDALYEFPGSPIRHAIESPMARRVLMGLSMGLTAVALIYSPWGKQSGAHMNPSTTLAFLRLGKIKAHDAFFYIASQFAGAAIGVLATGQFLRMELSHPSVLYAATVPGTGGPWIALLAEFIIAAGMMTMVLHSASSERLASFTGIFAGALLAAYITFEAPFSGMSLNPARTFGSALSANIWTAYWVYLVGPPAGMMAAAEIFSAQREKSATGCAKLHHTNERRCIHCGANGGHRA